MWLCGWMHSPAILEYPENGAHKNLYADINWMLKSIVKHCLASIAKFMMYQTLWTQWCHANSQPLLWDQVEICKDHKFFCLKSRKNMIRRTWAELPMSQSVIDMINQMRWKEWDTKGLTFMDRRKQITEETGDDSNFHSHIPICWKEGSQSWTGCNKWHRKYA